MCRSKMLLDGRVMVSNDGKPYKVHIESWKHAIWGSGSRMVGVRDEIGGRDDIWRRLLEQFDRTNMAPFS